MLSVKKIVIIIISAVLLLIPFLFINGRVMPWNQKEAIATALSWGELPPLPQNAKNVKVWKKGSGLNLQYTIMIQTNQTGIEEWIKLSRLKNMEPALKSESIAEYDILPGENGTKGGLVIIDKNLHIIIIEMTRK